jgi:putative endopeptidase
MKIHRRLVALLLLIAGSTLLIPFVLKAGDAPPRIPRFSVDYMDSSVNPGTDFYHYACGTWLKENPVPPDKARWGAFSELQERNWYLLHQILNTTSQEENPANSVPQKVGDFFKSAMDTNRLEQLGYGPIQDDLKRIEAVDSPQTLLRLLAEFHECGVGGCFDDGVSPDARNSAVYAFELDQGGLGLPDRDYYLTDAFAKQRAAYVRHMEKMFALLGEQPADAKAHAATVLDLETAIARTSKSRVDLRDPVANYHKVPVAELVSDYPDLPIGSYMMAAGVGSVSNVIVGQPEFFSGLDRLVKERPLADWKTYLRWHLIHESATYLNAAAENSNFAFYGTVLSGQPVQEPRWQRSAKVINSRIGEALGELYVEKYYPPAARARTIELVNNLKSVYRGRLEKVAWMTGGTRAKALAKFDLFTKKIGYPDKFRDYSTVDIRPDDYLGNVRRAAIFETRRQIARVGGPVDKTEWGMTPPTVNAYYNPSQNEIVFPAGILQPPFFDAEMDDAVNYGAIGVVIGHEMTHGYDDQGRKFDGHGNLSDWWTEADAKAFDARARKLVDQYNAYEPLPGLHVNGTNTLGENIADFGGMSISYEALEQVLAKDPSKRKVIDGFTPEQRFFLSFSQIWRTNCRDAETRRLITVDPHSPGQFRAIGPSVNLQGFFDAFGIKPGAPMWRPPEVRAVIW